MSTTDDLSPQLSLQAAQIHRRRRRLYTAFRALVLLATLYIIVAYITVPVRWRHVEHKHPALDQAPTPYAH